MCVRTRPAWQRGAHLRVLERNGSKEDPPKNENDLDVRDEEHRLLIMCLHPGLPDECAVSVRGHASPRPDPLIAPITYLDRLRRLCRNRSWGRGRFGCASCRGRRRRGLGEYRGPDEGDCAFRINPLGRTDHQRWRVRTGVEEGEGGEGDQGHVDRFLCQRRTKFSDCSPLCYRSSWPAGPSKLHRPATASLDAITSLPAARLRHSGDAPSSVSPPVSHPRHSTTRTFHEVATRTGSSTSASGTHLKEPVEREEEVLHVLVEKGTLNVRLVRLRCSQGFVL